MSYTPKRKNNPDEVRRRVLDAADRLFQTGGYHASAMQDIARAAGVTSGALHHHFPTKKALGLAVIEERVGPQVRETWVAPLQDAGAGRQAVGRVMEAISDALDAQGGVKGCPLNNLALELALADDDFRSALARVFADWQAGLAQRFEADGRPTGRARALAAMTVAAYSGAMAMAKAEQSTAPLRACAAELERMLA